MREQAATGTNLISPLELRDRLQIEPNLQLIDVREYPEFANGHVKGSRLASLSKLQHDLSNLDPNLPIVVLCQSGKRSARACEELAKAGFGNVKQLEGGIAAWKELRLPLHRKRHRVWSLERQVRFGAGLLMLLGLSLALKWPEAIALSWFVGAGLVFAAVTDTCAMGMLIAKLPWNRKKL